ncbi:MAG: ABC-2 type transporter family [Elusimicrobia bacterium]|nr:MAG: ABC-2 type transporter family [Elusimicrobiota bacterium]
MKKVAAIAVTEFVNTVRSRGFLLALMLTPVFIGISAVVQLIIKERIDVNDRHFAVHDPTGRLSAAVFKAAAERDLRPRFVPEAAPEGEPSEVAAALSKRVKEGTLFAFVMVDHGIVEGRQGAGFAYHAQTQTYLDLPLWLKGVFDDAVMAERVKSERIDAKAFARATKKAPLRRLGLIEIGPDGKPLGAVPASLAGDFVVPAAAMFLLFLLVFMSVPMLLHSVIEEKQLRIWEVLVASVSPFQLLMGKLLGNTLVSLSVSFFYLGGAVALAERFGVGDQIPPQLIAWFIVFQLLALLIYGSMFSAIGAACSELRDAQSLMTPAMFLLIVPMFGWVAILRAPDSGFARLLSLFPPATPMLMLLRIALPPGPQPWEVGLAFVLTTAFTFLCVWTAGKIFRIGILAQGQTPTIGRLISWVLAK